MSSTLDKQSATLRTTEADMSYNVKPCAQRNGRLYINDSTLQYPLPVDLPELNRQALRTLLLNQIYDGPLVSPIWATKSPRKVLEVGCGSGFWSMVCHQFFKEHGHTDIDFVGLDIVPLAPNHELASSASHTPDPDMKWTFVHHDIRAPPWPFHDDEFDIVVSRDMTYALSYPNHPHYMEENIRVLRPGGTIEIWETDHTIRVLRPQASGVASADTEPADYDCGQGFYNIGVKTPLSAPVNPFLAQYNEWITEGLNSLQIEPNPCIGIHNYLLQESDSLTSVTARRVALPFQETLRERDGAFAVTQTRTKRQKQCFAQFTLHNADSDAESSVATWAGLRQTALLILIGEIQGLELLLRDVSGKSEEEWERWVYGMMQDLLEGEGTRMGECMEIGVWWAQKRTNPQN